MTDWAEGMPPANQHVPMARPITVDAGVPLLPSAAPFPSRDYRPLEPAPSRLRAMLEVVALVPVGLLAAGLAYVIVPGVAARYAPEADGRWQHVGASVLIGLAMLGAVAVMLRIDGQRAAAIGLSARNFRREFWTGAVAFVTAYALLLAVAHILVFLRPEILESPARAQQGIEETFPRMTVGVLLLMMAFVAFWEEVVFRGFLLTRLYTLLRRWWLVVPAGAVLFAVPHWYQGPLAVVLIMGLAVIMSILLIWRRSLVPCIVFHFANNVVMLMALRAFSDTWR